MKVFAFYLITNMCYTEYETIEEANHDDVVTIGLRRQEKITKFVTRIVEEINHIINNNKKH
jgi:purine nucleoside phosphorylase